MNKYSEKLKDPRWQKKRLEIFQRDDFACQVCFDTGSPLAVHHLVYIPNMEPWDYPDKLLVTLCEEHHEYEFNNSNYAEKQLINSIKSVGFLSDELIKLSEGFENLPIFHIREVMAEVISFILKDENILRQTTRNVLSGENGKKETPMV